MQEAGEGVSLEIVMAARLRSEAAIVRCRLGGRIAAV